MSYDNVTNSLGVLQHAYFDELPPDGVDDCWIGSANADDGPPPGCRVVPSDPSDLCQGPNSVEQAPCSGGDPPCQLSYTRFYRCATQGCFTEDGLTTVHTPSTETDSATRRQLQRSLLAAQYRETGPMVLRFVVDVVDLQLLHQIYGDGAYIAMRGDGSNPARQHLVNIAELQHGETNENRSPPAVGRCGAPSRAGSNLLFGLAGCMTPAFYEHSEVNNVKAGVHRWQLAIMDGVVVNQDYWLSEIYTVEVPEGSGEVLVHATLNVSAQTLTAGYNSHPVRTAAIRSSAPPPPGRAVPSITVHSALGACGDVTSLEEDLTLKMQAALDEALRRGDRPTCLGASWPGYATALPHSDFWDAFLLLHDCRNTIEISLNATSAIDGNCGVQQPTWGECIDLSCAYFPVPPPPPMPPGVGLDYGLSVWASDTPAIHGARVVRFDQKTQARRTVIPIGLDSRGDPYKQRYWTLQNYAHEKKLRIDAFRVWGVPDTGASEASEAVPVPVSTPAAQPTTSPSGGGYYGRRASEQQQQQPETQYQPQSTDADDPRPHSWWNRIPTFSGRLYPMRNMPGIDHASAVSSVAVAASVSNHTDLGVPDAMLGHNLTMGRACAGDNLNCTFGGFSGVWIYEQAMPDSYADDVWHRDDLADAAWLLDAIIEPSVGFIFSKMLFCSIPEVCGDMCRHCPREAQPVKQTPQTGALEEEGKLTKTIQVVEGFVAHARDGGASRDVLECLCDKSCIYEIANDASQEIAGAAPTPINPAHLERLATANLNLVEGFRTSQAALLDSVWHKDNQTMFNTTLYDRHGMVRSHATVVLSLNLTEAMAPIFEGDRRLAEDEQKKRAEAPKVVVRAVQRMLNLTKQVCVQIGDRNLTYATQLHLKAVQQWSVLNGEGNHRTNSIEQFCTDCERLNETQSCKVFFALAGGRLTRLRKLGKAWDKTSEEGRELHAQRKRQLRSHIENKAKDLCCAKFESDGSTECGPQYCPFAFLDRAKRRLASASRTFAERHPNSSVSKSLGVDARIGIDYLHPEEHIDPECRGGALSELECMGRSLVGHLARKHGMHPTQIQDKLDQMGINVGENLYHAGKAFGYFPERRSGGDHRTDGPAGSHRTSKSRAFAEASAQAQKIMFQATKATGGRRLAETDAGRSTPTEPVTIEASADGDESLLNGRLRAQQLSTDRLAHPIRRQNDPVFGVEAIVRHYNGTREMRSAVQEYERAGRNARRDARRLQVRAEDGKVDLAIAGRTRVVHGAMPKIRAVQVPSLVWATMQSTRGSLSHRFDGFLQSVEAARTRHRRLEEESHARQEAMQLERAESRKRRRLAENAIGATPAELYDHLDRQLDGRRLKEEEEGSAGAPGSSVRYPHSELPESHGLSWLHDVVGGADGWRHGFSELRRLAAVERERQAMRESGLHSHDQIAARHPTGYARMDYYYQPSVLGDAIRRLHSRKTTGDDPRWWPKTSWWQSGRRMSEQEAQTAGAPSSHIRRLSTALFSSTLAAP